MDGPPINLKVYQNPQQVYIILLNKEFKMVPLSAPFIVIIYGC